MRRSTRAPAFFLFAVFFCASAFGAEAAPPKTWTLERGKLWSREAGKTTLTPTGKGLVVDSAGTRDWAVSAGERIPVAPGDIFEWEAALGVQGEGRGGVGFVLYDAQGETLDWAFGEVSRTETKAAERIGDRFMAPFGAAALEPRLTGSGPAVVRCEGFELRRAESRPARPLTANPDPIENDLLKLVPAADGTFAVEDKRTGRVWKQRTGNRAWMPTEIEADAATRSVRWKLLLADSLQAFEMTVALAEKDAELTVAFDAPGTMPMPRDIQCPAPFLSRKGDRFIIPLGEGIGVAADETDADAYQHLYTYGGHGLCMAFWGQVEDQGGAGLMAIVETPDDATFWFRPPWTPEGGEKALVEAQTSWNSQKKRFGYPRKLRFVFFDRGGHVAVAKRYRRYAKEQGLLVTFEEKARRNPALKEGIDRLLGAANIWFWDGGDKLALLREMKAAGMDRILWSGGGSGGEMAALNAMGGVLTSRYDIYQDIMDPALKGKVGWHADWVDEAWPHDLNWTDPDGTWRKGWSVPLKDDPATMVPCAVICDKKALPYARKRLAGELESIPFKARFIDTTTATPWIECYHPDHPMTRTDSRVWKMKLLELMGKEFNLVCGAETGHDAAVPYCDFFEGMLSLGPYKVPDAGRDMVTVWDEVPARVEKFQVGERYRLPLWELVYHDCCVATWYWGDYNNKLPKIWAKRDLFNALYGTPPMYMFTGKSWEEQKDRFAASYRVAQPVARKTAYREMTDHRILTEDRAVQQTAFAGGTRVTVNFGPQPFRMEDGTTLAPMASRIE